MTEATQHRVSPVAAAQVTYQVNQTYYRNRVTGVLFGHGMVQGSYLNPELEEMIAVSETQLVPVNNVRAQRAGEQPTRAARSRLPIRGVPRFDAKASELNYQSKPVAVQDVMQIRDPDGSITAAAAEQARKHAAQLVENTAGQHEQIQQREAAELQAKADYAEKARQATLANQANQRQQHVSTAQLANDLVPGQAEIPAAQLPGTPVTQGQAPVVMGQPPVDLTQLPSS